MTSIHSSSIDAEEVDLSGLVESVVDSDEEDLVESMENANIRDHVRDCLEKDPSERSENDVEVLLQFTQNLKAFTNMTLTVRRALCSVLVFAVVEKAGTVVMNDGEELDSWSVLINGTVEIEHPGGATEHLQYGDSFGIAPTMEKSYHNGIMRTKTDDCQFVCITQTDYYRILHEGEGNIRKHEESGKVVIVTELRKADTAGKREPVVIRGTPERLMLHLIEENSINDPTYVEDFLLTHRSFIESQIRVAKKLLEWFRSDEIVDELKPAITEGSSTAPSYIDVKYRVARVVILWVNNYFTDFETDSQMMEFLEIFEMELEKHSMLEELKLLHVAHTHKARIRTITLTRSSRDEDLHFKIMGGYEKGGGIFIQETDKNSKASETGLRRGDQILEVNGQNFEHVSYARAMEILTGTTHLSIGVKSNLLVFRELLNSTSRNSPRLKTKMKIASDLAKLQASDTRVRLSSVDLLTSSHDVTDNVMDPLMKYSSYFPKPAMTPTKVNNESHGKSNSLGGMSSQKIGGGFMTLGPKKRIQKALQKLNLLPKNTMVESSNTVNDEDDASSGFLTATTISSSSSSSSAISNKATNVPSNVEVSGQVVDINGQIDDTVDDDKELEDHNENECRQSITASTTTITTMTSVSSGGSAGTSTSGNTNFYAHPENQQQEMAMFYDDIRSVDYPEHVLKVYKPDQTYKFLLIHKETTAHEVVMLALQEFGMHDPSSNYSLCEVSVGEGGMIKQRRLPEQLQNLAERIGLSSRYYLKTNGISETLVPDEMASELVRENIVHFLQLNPNEMAIQLTSQDFQIFRQIESTEYIDDLFMIKSNYGTPMLNKFSELVNNEMFWVVSEVCRETNIVRRSKILKQFIKIARHCKECKNFNSVFAIISGLGHASVSRLRLTWEKLPNKYQKLFNDLQELMDPSRNMSKYRQLVAMEMAQKRSLIPFYPVVKKDLTFIHLGNDTKIDGLINFEKLRMISKEVRSLMDMCSSPTPYMDSILNMLDIKSQPNAAMSALNQITTTIGHTLAANIIQHGSATVKRRKKSAATPNPKKMFEEAQMVRKVKAYLNNIQIIKDEEKLHVMSLECEPAIVISAPNSVTIRKRHPSPTLSTTSSTSSKSDGMKAVGPKFGTASPQAVKKILSLAENSKTRPHQSRLNLPHHGGHLQHHTNLSPSPSPSPGSHRRIASNTGKSTKEALKVIIVIYYDLLGSTAWQPLHCFAPLPPTTTTKFSHERSHSDTPNSVVPSVDLSAESR
jgi:Rap guanine nucleotide exchange factor 2